MHDLGGIQNSVKYALCINAILVMLYFTNSNTDIMLKLFHYNYINIILIVLLLL